MADMEMLRNKIDERGMTITALSRKSGILRATLYNRLKGKGIWKANEIVSVSYVLKLTKAERDHIFLV